MAEPPPSSGKGNDQERDDAQPPDVAVDETEFERWQRNYAELLQELRVAQAGVQILFAFLLTLAFNGRFSDADGFQEATYLVALLASAAAAALILAPVAQHRQLFRQGRKPELVRSAHRMARAGMILLFVAMVSSVLLATDVVLPRPAAITIATATAALFAYLWWLLPTLHHPNDNEPEGR